MSTHNLSRNQAPCPRSIQVLEAFTFSAAVLLICTAFAKLLSATGNAKVLQSQDPVFSIPFRTLFWVVGGIELIVAFACLLKARLLLQLGLIGWLATNFVIYRLGLSLLGYRKPCPCLGSLTDELHLSMQTAESILIIVLAYLLIGSYIGLIWLLIKRRAFA